MSELEGRQLSYESSVTFSTLKTSDGGSYVCSANIVPEEDILLASLWVSESLNITVCECTEFHSYIFSNNKIIIVSRLECLHQCELQPSI